MDQNPRPLSVSIVTRNRPERVRACLRSLSHIAPLVDRALVIDDASDPPLPEPPCDDLPVPVTLLRAPEALGPVPARNQIARLAATEFILGLDDDAALLDGAGVLQALAVLQNDPKVLAVAFAQADAQGRVYDLRMQPATVDYPCQVPSYGAYGCLTRRETFLRLGGYQELLGFEGDEKELSLRALEAGYRVVYLPEAKVAHLHDVRGRDQGKRFRWSTQSSCLQYVLNQPLILILPATVGRLLLYGRQRRSHSIHDPWAAFHVLQWLFSRLPAAWRVRRPVRWSTLRLWKKLRKNPPRYSVAGA